MPLSCGPCRHRKLKCNRSHPCENCVRRGDAASCSYAAPGTRKKNQSQGATSPDDMQNRIDRLEGLVLSLMTNGAQSAGPTAAAAAIARTQSDSAGSSAFPIEVDRGDDDMIPEEGDEDEDHDSEVDGVANSLGVLKVDSDKGKSFYVGDSHWHLVLADIAEVKNFFIQHKKELDRNYEMIRNTKPTSATEGPAFLFSQQPLASEAQLRAELPPKPAVDKLVTRYFNSYDPAVHILHSPTFHKQLRTHWQDPSKTSLVWLGLLYAILCLGMQSYHKIGDEPPEWKGRAVELATEYRLRTVQCLINSDYTKSSIYTIEALILYTHGEYTARWDGEVGIWIVVGMIVRLAMRMGYHRDPSHYPGITPYQAEMRRRVWTFVRQMDILFSFQLALPHMIRDSDCDAFFPRNIFEDEFGPESKVLPPARPDTEPTPVSYMIMKSRITYQFGLIIEQLNPVNGKQVSYDEILRRDNLLRDMKATMTPHLRLRPMEECMHDPATLLMQRYSLDILWQKTMCVLHRKYMTRARTNHRYSHSRRSCVDAAMEILRHQAKLHRESQLGGRMRSMKWFISSLTKSDYLLAATIVCLDLYQDTAAEALSEHPPAYDPYFWTPEQRAEMLRSLETSQSIWLESVDTSLEAFKASKILGIMLDKLKAPAGQPQQPQAEAQSTAEAFAAADEASLKPEQSAAMSLGMLSGGLSPNTNALFNSTSASLFNSMGQMDMTMGEAGGGGTGLTPNYGMDATNTFGMAPSPFTFFGSGNGGNVELPTNLDWDAWDSYIQNGNGIDPALQYFPPVPDQSQGDSSGGVGGSSSVFMGANTPGK